ncbi:ead/Ea22-like family protein [Escherichia coli]|uniref:ead/Ea22-like family protein n=1 Tax=Escherichia coli TaxID=562 RepID=UPI0005CD3E07|nr:ead/Ea22-like family protein [Escherichia coli]EFW8106404.1 ead/Ea22-like family protein [Shigella sonnei]EIG6218673.1 ead/Ea22-like family protein [Shigella dysenteriae]EIH4991163.1 ead/Ea22-like family protein [Shigella boydii]HDL6813253.1 ead/Ea22-like family protein [Escherichia coli 371_08]HDL6818023.1 ead/Ea22-like family protein [Escherichia coli 290_10]HDL6832622.1 ead/Ea22-like family protein [Escherichia coli 229_11]HDL7560465.1 ead/Ea22-like family protein [Escherichia coli 151
MNKIDYQALREAAEAIKIAATPQKLLAFRMKVTPQVVLALLDELETKEEQRANWFQMAQKLGEDLDAEEKRNAEQREYYEGVIADGSKRIAELEKSEEQLINERDHAESALADMYFAVTRNRPEWSNCFSFSDAVDAVVDRIADLEAKQPSPVVPEEMYWQDAPVEGSSKATAYATGWNACRAATLQGPEGLIKAVRFYEQVKRENPPVETGAWKDAVDWVLQEACQAVHWCRQISALQEQENHS